MKKVKIAIIGCGGIARRHLSAYKSIIEREPEKFEIVAVLDPSQEARDSFSEEISKWQKFKPTTYSNIDEMLTEAKNLDGADICTPHYEHHTVGVKCLNSGINILVEKPIGITIKATKQIINAAKKK